MTFRLSAVLLLGSTVLLSACGFHLRGNTSHDFALQELDLKARNAYGETVRELRSQLENGGVQIHAKAPYRLILTRESEEKRIISHNNSARSAEYELAARLDFEIRDRADLPLLHDQLETWRAYAHDDSNLASSDEEVARLRGEIRQELLQQLTQRLQHLTPEQLAKLQTEAEARAARQATTP